MATPRANRDDRERTRPTSDHWFTSPAALWTVQALLAVAFLFTGGAKLFASSDTLTEDSAFPALFLRFIGLCEILGAIGLTLPGIVRRYHPLTPIAAAGLVIIMIGATITELAMGHGAVALSPFLLGVFAAFVAWARSRVGPWRPSILDAGHGARGVTAS